MRILLDENWKLSGSWPFDLLRGTSMETGIRLSSVTPVIDARVPGSVYDDLLRAGLIADPYYERNSLLCEWVENRFWSYRTDFRVPEEYAGRRIRLVLKGIDYHAHIFLNDSKIAEHTGMYAPCTVDVTDLIEFKKTNSLTVLLENAPNEMGQIGYTSRTFTQKARFGYKWDFGTRLVNLGLYDIVYLEIADDSLADVSIRYLGDGLLEVTAENSYLAGTLTYAGEMTASGTAESTGGRSKLTLKVKDPHLWYPNGMEEGQPLYDLTLTTRDDEKKYRVGLRTLQYRKPKCQDEAILPYIPVINGREVYIKGVNMVPLDHMYGRVTRERYRTLLTLAKEANVNLIRVWGGGLIEKEDFYELCDEYGIMVWQEFIQSSSGIDNIPSKRPEFLKLCGQTARAVIPEKRNHVSLTFWSGGNELMDEEGIPSTYGDPNIAMLKGIAGKLNPDILMLPTSASGPTEWFDAANPSRNHDIHGPWKYEGVEGQYALYNRSTIILHSEFGVDGMTNMESLCTVLAPENQKVTTVEKNLTWRHHGEWWDTYSYREQPLFGVIDKLDELVTLSQYMQAEGIRYAIEAHRRRAKSAVPARLAEGELAENTLQENIGSIVWQINEPWPNVSCTCLVDYYEKPKLAYYFYRDAQEPLHISMRYEKFLWRPGEIFEGLVFVNDDRSEGYDAVEVRAYDGVWQYNGDNASHLLKADYSGNRISFTVPAGDSFVVECSVKKRDCVKKHAYLFLIGEMGRAPREPVLRFTEGYCR